MCPSRSVNCWHKAHPHNEFDRNLMCKCAVNPHPSGTVYSEFSELFLYKKNLGTNERVTSFSPNKLKESVKVTMLGG